MLRLRPQLKTAIFPLAVFFLFALLMTPQDSAADSAQTLPLKRLDEKQIQTVRTVLAKLEPMIKEREARENLATLRFEELYAPLADEERRFVRLFQDFEPLKAGIKTTWHGLADGNVELTAVRGQHYRKAGQPAVLPTVYVPPHVYRAYQQMMQAMQKDLGKKLLIESGYRSSAYQLYLFISYLQNHDYSVRETAHWNAFPGYSEHGNPASQALDFINEDGISGETDPEAFAALPEYQWLQQHAAQYQFKLSFPKNDPKGTGFEPWHWRYTGGPDGEPN